MPTDDRESPWREVLPLVIDTAAKSAEASAEATSVLSSFENRLGPLENSVDSCKEKLATLVALEEERKARDVERSAWLRSVVTPQFIAYVIALILALAGFRVTMPIGTVTTPTVEDAP